MDIGSNNSYPSCALSNFEPYDFTVSGVECKSMEGFIQSLKVKDQKEQEKICQLTGFAAKVVGLQHNDWKIKQKLYWKGFEYPRKSIEYQLLLDKAYMELFKNERFRKALEDTGDEVLTHSIGNTNPRDTVLTIDEFCTRLMALRKRLKTEKTKNF